MLLELLVAPRNAKAADQAEECRLDRSTMPKLLQEAAETIVKMGRLCGMFQSLSVVPRRPGPRAAMIGAASLPSGISTGLSAAWVGGTLRGRQRFTVGAFLAQETDGELTVL